MGPSVLLPKKSGNCLFSRAFVLLSKDLRRPMGLQSCQCDVLKLGHVTRPENAGKLPTKNGNTFY